MSISKPAAIRSGSWDQWFEYIAGDVVLGSDGNLYRALSGNTNTNPVGGNSTWEYLPLPRQYATTAELLSGSPDYNGQVGSAADGGLAVATGGAFSQAFSIASLTTSGNAAVGGTLGVTGAGTFSTTLGVTGTATMALINATSTATEHTLVLNVEGTPGETSSNVVSLKNANTGSDSAARFLDASGKERGAIGYGNTGQSSSYPFYGRTYVETSDVDNTGTSPEFIIVQSSTFNSAITYGTYGRVHLDPNGSVFIYPIGCNGSQLGASYADVAFSWSTPGTAQGVVTMKFGNYPYGAAQAIIACEDLNEGIYFRFKSYNSPVANTMTFTSYGDTLANTGGFAFYTGGSLAAQTLKFQVANDGVKAAIPLGVPGYTISGLPTPPSAGFHAYVTNASQTLASNIGAVVSGTGSNVIPVFYDGTSWRVG